MGAALKDKVAVVTGSGRGIGWGIALLMAEEGARVVVNDLGGSLDGNGASTSPADEVVREIKSRGGVAVASYDTVATIAGGKRIIQTALDSFGRIDILVNNAGVFATSAFTEISERDWDTIIQVHLKGHFACTQAAVPHMIKQSYGRIINISSTAALGPAIPGEAHYATAKAGILGFTRCLARELGGYGITVNAVMPLAQTRLSEAIDKVTATKGVRPDPEDSAPIVAYLATDKAGGINGVTFAARAKGVIQLYSDPLPTKAIYKEQRWSVADLIDIIPKTLGAELVNPSPPRPEK